MRAKTMRISHRLLTLLLKKLYPLPSDFEVVRAYEERENGTHFQTIVTSDTFDNVKEGRIIPEMEAAYYYNSHCCAAKRCCEHCVRCHSEREVEP